MQHAFLHQAALIIARRRMLAHTNNLTIARERKNFCPPGYLRCVRGILLSAQLRPPPSPDGSEISSPELSGSIETWSLPNPLTEYEKRKGAGRKETEESTSLSCPLLGLCVILQTLHEALQLGCEIRVRRRLPLLLRDCIVRHTVIRNELSNRVQKRDQAATLVHGAESLPHGCIQRHIPEQ